MSIGYYQYKQHEFTCKGCGWIGLGRDTEVLEYFDDFFDIGCPKCFELLETISNPDATEVRKFGTNEDKAALKKQKALWKRMSQSMLQSADQLPDIPGNEKLIFQLLEKYDGTDTMITISQNGNELWTEIAGYEYYARYMELGNLLQEKYPGRVVDFIPEETPCFFGDSIQAIVVIDNYRKNLGLNK